MLIILSGLSGVGKTMIARQLARQLNAVHVHIDSIEQAIRDSELGVRTSNDAGYLVGYAVALDNLCVGRTVIADSVNPLAITRNAWVEVASRAKVGFVEIEVTCSDASEYRHRLENRPDDIPGLSPLTWQDVLSRGYQVWDHEHAVLDTAARSVEQTVEKLRELLPR